MIEVEAGGKVVKFKDSKELKEKAESILDLDLEKIKENTIGKVAELTNTILNRLDAATYYFTKIKVKGATVNLEYEQEISGDTVESKLNKEDLPLSTFREAMQALCSDVVKICEFPKDWEKDIEVLSVSLKYSSETKDLLGINICALRTLESSNSPMVINTPYKAFEDKNDNEMVLAPYGCYSKVEKILAEAEKYLKGERANKQMSLFQEGQE